MPPKPLMNASLYDNLSTPLEAVAYLVPYLPQGWVVWEPAVGEGMLADGLEHFGYTVIRSGIDYNGEDFLSENWFKVLADGIITNPPFSKKTQFLKRCRAQPLPWALLLPITTLGARRCQQYMDDVGVLLLPKRIDFTGKRAPWFSVAWFCHGLGFDGRIMIT